MKRDNTANERQKRRIERLEERGLKRKTIFVHKNCEESFNVLKNFLKEPEFAYTLDLFTKKLEKKKPVNVSQVRQLSPFRYPGGKTWLVPELRKWVKEIDNRPDLFIEPFAGGAISSLTIAAENLAERVIMAELDPAVASVWKTILEEPDYLADQIRSFNMTLENVKKVLSDSNGSFKEQAFQTIIKNRTFRGGILAPGASLVKAGENGKGIKSRWYPETLAKRIHAIKQIRSKISFFEKDAFQIIEKYSDYKNACFFIDPPYTAGGKNAGKRLYTYSEIDHEKLFNEMAAVKGHFLMTYADSKEVKTLANKHKFKIDEIPMKSTHHKVIYELLITNRN